MQAVKSLYNPAQIILLKLGFDSAQLLAHLKGQNTSHCKKGPGRKHQFGGEKTTEQKRAGAYGRGLRNWINQQQAARMANRERA